MNPRVSKVIPNEDYTLTILFTNGETKKYNVSPLLDKGVFSKLRNINLFKQARVTFGTVEWPDEIDICPDTLYEDSEIVN
jgi:Protein of unknown function (DUF2442)